uniref:Granulin a n=1 Tax=Oryzias sinensis TaxID=183150 RepID=A0A8C7YEJ3_9TELE
CFPTLHVLFLVIPWYTKIPATDSIQADSSFVQCSAVHQCPEHMSCCRLFTGEWGCCPLPNAVCCGDKEHCCPEGYTCDLASKSCHKLLTLQLETVPLTPVFLPDDQSQRGPVKPILNRCDDVYKLMTFFVTSEYSAPSAQALFTL